MRNHSGGYTPWELFICHAELHILRDQFVPLKRRTKKPVQWKNFLLIRSSGSRGGPREPCPPSVPDKDYLLCTSWHFLVKNPLDQLNNEFYGPYFIFFQKKISALASLGMNIILLSYSSGPTLLIISFIFYFLMCILLHYNDSSHNLSCL